jgi:predicted PurR-regulated permease PerM
LLNQFDRVRTSIPGLAPAPAASTPPPRASAARGAPPPPPADPVKDRLVSEGVALTGVVLEHSLAFAVSAAATVILLYFLLTSERWMLSRCVEAIPRPRARALLLSGVRAAQREMAHYLFAVGCINSGMGALTGLALWALGLPNPVLWAVIVAVLNFVPYLGPMLSIGMLLLAGMMSFTELQSILAPAGAFALIHVIESNLFSPWVVGRRLALSPLSVLLSVMFWGWLWGIAGALIAVPTLITAHNLFRRHRRLRPWARILEGDFNAPPPLRVLLRARPRLRAGVLRGTVAGVARQTDGRSRAARQKERGP